MHFVCEGVGTHMVSTTGQPQQAPAMPAGFSAGAACNHRRAPCCRPSPPPAHQVETLEVLLAPMAKAGADPLGSMGNDAPLAPMRCVWHMNAYAVRETRML